MEPSASKITYSILTRVAKIEEKKITMAMKPNHVDPQNPHVERESLGWFVLMEGSSEFIHLGFEQPDLNVGDKIEITIRRR